MKLAKRQPPVTASIKLMRLNELLFSALHIPVPLLQDLRQQALGLPFCIRLSLVPVVSFYLPLRQQEMLIRWLIGRMPNPHVRCLGPSSAKLLSL